MDTAAMSFVTPVAGTAVARPLPRRAFPRSPRAAALAFERAPVLPAGFDERLLGYGAMGVSFSTGHFLALRRVPASSIGPAFTSVWHRDVTGAWHIHTDGAPELSCPRYIGSAATGIHEGPIELSWIDDWTVVVDVPHAGILWTIRSRNSAISHVLGRLTAHGRGPTIYRPSALRLLEAVSRRFLRAGPVGFEGDMPNGQRFSLHPQSVWPVVDSHATIHEIGIGRMETATEPVTIGGLRMPQRPLMAAAVVRFANE